jgi:hypothetical protein
VAVAGGGTVVSGGLAPCGGRLGPASGGRLEPTSVSVPTRLGWGGASGGEVGGQLSDG